MKTYTLHKRQFLPFPLKDVFAFFQKPENLALITPPSLGFSILTPQPVKMQAGTLIDYTVRLMGMRVRWTSLIAEYEPPHRFVDVQIRGPYSFWHHTHLFEGVEKGTWITDEVRYSLGFGFLGRIVNACLVKRDLERIFSYRASRIEGLIREHISGGRQTQAAGRGGTMKIVISGATGFIGSALVERLAAEGHEVTVLTRRPEKAAEKDGKARFAGWDARNQGSWSSVVDGADAVINMAGQSIAGNRWTGAEKKKIRESRVFATRALVEAMKKAARKPPVFVSFSAVGYYGDVPEGDVTEDSPRGKGFLADVCEAWESEAREAERLGIRVAIPRLGVVLDRGGGAMDKMLPPFRFFIGGPLGSGRQWFPWVHREEVVEMVLFALKTSSLSGPFNATAPEPARMKDFCRELGKAMDRPCWAPVPAFALRILLGEMADMLLTGQKAVPSKLSRCGYSFRYPELDQALNSILAE